MDKTKCKASVEGMLGKDMLIPLFSSSSSDSGNNATYTLYGFGKFRVTGFNFPGISEPDNYAGAPKCTGTCSGFIGYFSGFVTIQEYQAMQPGSITKTVKLIK
ncbi:hypothetical protein [Arthrobacter psychrolactophilus]